MFDKLEEVFNLLDVDYYRQGSFLSTEELPETFFTFWNPDTKDGAFYDNKENKTVWTWYVYFYTNDATLIYSKMNEFITIAKEKGFIISGKDHDIDSGSPGLFGRYVQIKYIV